MKQLLPNQTLFSDKMSSLEPLPPAKIIAKTSINYLLNFFYYLCVMENKYKTGKHILDNHIKIVKKLTILFCFLVFSVLRKKYSGRRLLGPRLIGTIALLGQNG